MCFRESFAVDNKPDDAYYQQPMIPHSSIGQFGRLHRLPVILIALAVVFTPVVLTAQSRAKVELGSKTAKNGFRNEDDIKEKFMNWRDDADAKSWLTSMGYRLSDIQ